MIYLLAFVCISSAALMWLAWRAAIQADEETAFWIRKCSEMHAELVEANTHLDFYIGELGKIQDAEIARAAARLYVLPTPGQPN